MKQLKVGTRLALGFALVLVMLLAVIVLGIAKLFGKKPNFHEGGESPVDVHA